MCELTFRASHFPDPVIWLMPDLLEMTEQRAFDRPRMSIRRNARSSRHVHRIEQLAADIQLQLFDSRIADADRPRCLVSGEPGDFELRETPLPVHAVRRLHRRGIAGDGAQQPVAPGGRLLRVAADHQRVERKRGVT
jgi:hypothetical protein